MAKEPGLELVEFEDTELSTDLTGQFPGPEMDSTPMPFRVLRGYPTEAKGPIQLKVILLVNFVAIIVAFLLGWAISSGMNPSIRSSSTQSQYISGKNIKSWRKKETEINSYTLILYFTF